LSLITHIPVRGRDMRDAGKYLSRRLAGRHRLDMCGCQRFAANCPVTLFDLVDTNPGNIAHGLAFNGNHGVRDTCEDSAFLFGSENVLDDVDCYEWHFQVSSER
jgi:hypothetical protein